MGAARIVVVGTSWGGLNALSHIVDGLPLDFRLPIIVVQHRGRESDETMTNVLQARCKRPVREAEDKEPIQAGYVYLAPPDYHLLVDEGFLALSIDEPVAYSRPSIDVLFESAADAYGPGVVGVLLTGANQDGTRGLARIKKAGGYVVVQDPDSAEVAVMPESAIAGVAVDVIVPLDRIASVLVALALASSGLRDGAAAQDGTGRAERGALRTSP
jgi:two-component system chemotaxis response regulator CheB